MTPTKPPPAASDADELPDHISLVEAFELLVTMYKKDKAEWDAAHARYAETIKCLEKRIDELEKEFYER